MTDFARQQLRDKGSPSLLMRSTLSTVTSTASGRSWVGLDVAMA